MLFVWNDIIDFLTVSVVIVSQFRILSLIALIVPCVVLQIMFKVPEDFTIC
jgi:hypothetical protein